MLRWVGDRKGLVGIVGIPARDISKEEFNENKSQWAEILGVKESQVVKALLGSGAYELFTEIGKERSEE